MDRGQNKWRTDEMVIKLKKGRGAGEKDERKIPKRDRGEEDDQDCIPDRA